MLSQRVKTLFNKCLFFRELPLIKTKSKYENKSLFNESYNASTTHLGAL